MITQKYAKPAEIRQVFKTLNDNRTLTRGQMVKEPVTTLEACEFLHDKMDETQDNLLVLITNTMVSVPQAFSEEFQNNKEPEPASGDSAPPQAP